MNSAHCVEPTEQEEYIIWIKQQRAYVSLTPEAVADFHHTPPNARTDNDTALD